MPGNILSAECPCGFKGGARVGVVGLGLLDSEILVAAFDPDKNAIVSICEREAVDRNLTIFDDPYAYNAFKLVLEGDTSEIPEGHDATFQCPRCRKNELRFYKFGTWD